MNKSFLKKNWDALTNNLPDIRINYYTQLIQLYSHSERYYHDLNHIESLLFISNQYDYLLSSPKTIQFAIWYHDAIYDASKNNNEELSAELAKSHLAKMGVSDDIVSDCFNLILLTKKHEINKKVNSFDAQFLLDIDLSILAAPRAQYMKYSKQIREEYKMYSDESFKTGRKQVLQHFLNSERIYKTDLFYSLNEKKARKNLAFELNKILSLYS